jgi:hypothetical protein
MPAIPHTPSPKVVHRTFRLRSTATPFTATVSLGEVPPVEGTDINRLDSVDVSRTLDGAGVRDGRNSWSRASTVPFSRPLCGGRFPPFISNHVSASQN